MTPISERPVGHPGWDVLVDALIDLVNVSVA